MPLAKIVLKAREAHCHRSVQGHDTEGRACGAVDERSRLAETRLDNPPLPREDLQLLPASARLVTGEDDHPGPLSFTAAISARCGWIRLSRVTMSHPSVATCGIHTSSLAAGSAMGQAGRSRRLMTAPGSPG